MKKAMHTKWGTAIINGDGYYQISSNEKGYRHGLLHRLIWEDFYGCEVPKGYHIHHKNFNKLDNCILNLQLISISEHGRVHNSGSDNNFYGKNHSKEDMVKMSGLKSTTGFFRVTKPKMKNYKQGFAWCYQYCENGKRYSLYATSCEKLEKKVRNKGLLWKEL